MANAEHLKILKEGVERWNRWREENEDVIPNLSSADLQSADLSFANLKQAILSEANLGNANLFHAYLDGANLIGASLNDAQLSETDLTGANLTGADLNNANLFYTYLNGVKLKDIKMGYTVFSLTDLSGCEGLESAEIDFPCSIDFQTLRASRNLPKSFLLKIGLPELYIDYLPDFFQNEGIRYYPVFLSHSWENKDFARKLYEALIGKGVNVFFDEKKLKPGDLIYKRIGSAIDHYDKMILVCSKDSLKSWWVDLELDNILNKRAHYKEQGEPIDELLIPITIDDYVFQWISPRADEVRRYMIGNFKAWEEDDAFERALNDLIHALNVDRLEIKPPSFINKK